MVDIEVGDLVVYKSQRGDGSRYYDDSLECTQVVTVMGLGHCGKGMCSGLLKRQTDFYGLTKRGLRNLTFKGIIKVLPGKAKFLTMKTKI